MQNLNQSLQPSFIDTTTDLLREKVGSNIDAYELALTLLASAKLFADEPPNLPGKIGGYLNGSIRSVGPASFVAENFFNRHKTPLSRLNELQKIDPELIDRLNREAAGLIQRTAHFQIDDLLPKPNMRAGRFVFPQFLVRFMSKLLEVKTGSTIYAPWDTFTQFSNEISRSNSFADIETPMETSIPLLLRFLTSTRINITRSDPLKQPYYKTTTTDERYAGAIAIPPAGQLHDRDPSRLRMSKHYPEESQNSTILAIRLLLSMTQGRIVMLVPYSFLFASGQEKEVRKDLLSKGAIKAVVGLPQNYVAPNSPSLAILVLDQRGKADNVIFSQLGDIRPYERGSSKAKTIDLSDERANEIINLIDSKNINQKMPSENAKVAVELLLNQDGNLSVDRQFSDNRQVRKPGDRKTRPLGSLFQILRPLPFAMTKVIPDHGQHQEAAWEITAADLPDFGLVSQASKPISIYTDIATKFHQAFVKENDIILMQKGSVGKVGLIQIGECLTQDRRWLVGQSGLILRDANNVANPVAVFMFLRSPKGQAILRSIVSGSATPFLTLPDLIALQIPDFSDGEIFDAFNVFNQECQIQKQLTNLKAEQERASRDLWRHL